MSVSRSLSERCLSVFVWTYGWPPILARDRSFVRRLADYMPAQSGSVQPATATAIIVIGGFGGSSRLSSGERFDPAQNAWSPIASMGTARQDHAAVAL